MTVLTPRMHRITLMGGSHASASGVWIKDLPITPEKILRALKEREEEK